MTPDDGQEILVKQRGNRPVSPHLSIYRPQVSWILSSAHRITGVALSSAFYVFGLSYLAAPYMGFEMSSGALVSTFASLPIFMKIGLKTIASVPFTFHAFNGIRHLMWDMTVMLNNKGVIRSGYAVLGATAISSLVLALL